MQDNILEETIKISATEHTTNQVKILDEKGSTYSFFKQKKAGGNTKAYDDFQKFGKPNATVTLAYTLAGTYGKIKNVIGIRPADATTAQAATQKREAYFDGRDKSILVQVAYKGVIKLMAAGKLPGDLSKNILDHYLILRRLIDPEVGRVPVTSPDVQKQIDASLADETPPWGEPIVIEE